MADRKHLSREEIAKLEIGHTDSTPAINWFLTLFFLAVVTLVPVLQFGREWAAIRAGKEPGRRVPQSLDVFSFLFPSRAEVRSLVGAPDGLLAAGSRVNNRMLADIQTYETELKERDALMQWVIPRMQIPVTAWLRGGNEDAYCGRDGWLFYRKDIDSLTSRGFLDPEVLARRAAGGSELKLPPQPDPIKAIRHFRDQLAARGIALVVVPAPVKPSIYPERFSGRYAGRDEAVQNPSFGDFLARLAAAQVGCFDPTPLLLDAKRRAPAGGLYLATDTHWTPAGMELTARGLAEVVRQAAALPPATDRFRATEREVTGRGDVAMMLKLPAGMEVFAPETVRARPVMDGGGPWRPDPRAEVLFLGDSFANIYSLAAMGWGEAAGLAEHLSLALGLPVDTITRNDAGSHATREMLAKELQRGNDRLAGKKVVVWEFASRELACGDWKILPLQLGSRQADGFYQPPTGRAVAVRGVVRAASAAPRPGSVPYKDHILMVHLGELESDDDPAAAGREAVVLTWSMQDNVQAAAARWRPGDRVALRLRRWDEVGQTLESINRSELDAEPLLLAEPVWGEPSGTDAGRPAARPAAEGGARPEPRPATATTAAPEAGDPAAVFRGRCARQAEAGEGMVVPGRDGWLFLRNDFRHLGAGPFWAAANAGTGGDPLPAIVDFKDQLAKAGIALLLVPVPPKAVIYPEQAFPEEPPAAAAPRLDAALERFYGVLAEQGVEVLDLVPAMRAERTSGDAPLLYCKTDTHWSSRGCELAARLLKERIIARGIPVPAAAAFAGEETSITFVGDLAKDLRGPEAASETLPARQVKPTAGNATVSGDSPILLLGDSHTLVFHEGGDMLATGAGLADQLALELGAPVDLLGVRGSAATAARVNLLRRTQKAPDYLAGKKLVVYCFAAREFTESQGWRKVPIVK